MMAFEAAIHSGLVQRMWLQQSRGGMPAARFTSARTFLGDFDTRTGPKEARVVQPCRLTISLIQIGAKCEVQPLETG